MNYRRGDVVTCALPGDFGKPLPAVVLQSDLFNPSHTSVTLCPLTSHCIETPLFRVTIKPAAANGLKFESQAMTDKLTTLRAERIGGVVGHLSDADHEKIEEAVQRWLGLKG